MSERPTLICLMPVKNEGWILDRSLAAASLWADHVIVADQGSVDGSREIARRHPKVVLIDNPDSHYDEGQRQELLLKEARRIDGKRVIIALDADEALSGNWRETEEWERMLSAPRGTVLYFPWANVLPDWQHCWIPSNRIPFGFIDDGREHSGTVIHDTRIPVEIGSPDFKADQVKVLHFQYTVWDRMKSKQRWYQCWERIHFPQKRPIQIYRQYHQMDARPTSEIAGFEEEWLAPYTSSGIDFRASRAEDVAWYDRQVLEWLRLHGAERFRRVDLWDVDWSAVSREAGIDMPAELLRDPRSRSERTIMTWLARTQDRQLHRRIRWLQRLLIPFGW